MSKKIFISHSTKDEFIISDIKNLLQAFINDYRLSGNYDIFYSPESLKEIKQGSSEWKKRIKDEMAESSYCIVLFTKNSIENRWVNYELGLATASSKMERIIPLKVSGINCEQIIVNELDIIDISEGQHIIDAFKLIFEGLHNHTALDNWARIKSAEDKIKVVSEKSKERCVYIVGSKPKVPGDFAWDERVEDFVNRLSEELLKLDFKLASFPSVHHIGKLVAHNALNVSPNSYEIAGLYEFDKKIKKMVGISELAWEHTLNKFRLAYLENKESMIIIGGGNGTEKEYMTARSIEKIQIFPIPCFGGFGAKLFDILKTQKHFAHLEHPCTQCDSLKKKEKCPHLNVIVERIKEYKLLNSVSGEKV